MNLLTDKLPEAVLIDGKKYYLNTDFGTCIKIILAFEDNDLVGIEKSAVLVDLLYKEKPKNIGKAIELGVRFLDGGEAQSGDGDSSMRLYSFAKDANYILAAFQQVHGIDLTTEQMHWWKFLALFMDLGADTTFNNIVNLRKRLKTGKATKEEREWARENSDILELEEIDNRSLDEREADEAFLKQVKDARNRRENLRKAAE